MKWQLMMGKTQRKPEFGDEVQRMIRDAVRTLLDENGTLIGGDNAKIVFGIDYDQETGGICLPIQYSLLTEEWEEPLPKGFRVFDLPKVLPEDRVDAMLLLVQYLTIKIQNYIRIVNANAGRTKEQRSEHGRKAVAIRWGKVKD